MSQSNPLLFDLFLYLRKSGVPLGINDYLLLLSILREGKGLDDLESFKFICRLLWAKSPEDQQLFDEAFALLVEPRLKPRPAPSAWTLDPSEGKKPAEGTWNQTPAREQGEGKGAN